MGVYEVWERMEYGSVWSVENGSVFSVGVYGV